MKHVLFVLVLISLALPTFAAHHMPGKGITVNPARATWNTGYFQEAIVRAGLTELGYKVKKPKELQNPIFYQSVVLGDVDYWANGWFPGQNGQLPANFAEKAEKVGYVVKAGGLQGYLVSKKEAEKFNIKSLDDFKRPEVKKAFDSNGDGKADLTSCPAGWNCEKTTAHHMDVYGLKDDINLIKASYSATIADVLARYRAGEAVFFYSWTPNWTVHKMKPGIDVMWINVPKIMPTEAQKIGEDRMTVTGVFGSVTDPLKAGFVVSDIQVVANKEFLGKNPAAKKFFEVFKLPLSAISEQNTQMQDGEKSQKDIERHAQEWIKKNQATWDGWLEAARKAAM